MGTFHHCQALARHSQAPARADPNAGPGQWVGGVKSAIGKWRRRTPLPEPQLLSGAAPEPQLLSGVAPEPDGLGTRTRAGGTESKVIRAATRTWRWGCGHCGGY